VPDQTPPAEAEEATGTTPAVTVPAAGEPGTGDVPESAPTEGDPTATEAPTGAEPVVAATMTSDPAATDPAAAESSVTERSAAPGPVTDRLSGVRLPRRLVFRVPGSSLVAVVFLAMCSSWVAVASPWFTLVYLVPLGLAVWVLRTRTVVDADKLVVRRVLTRRELPWSSVASLRVADRKWVRAVRVGGGEVVLPTVRTRHLPALALVSGGRLSDPTEPAA
jgi:hypothetical protein